MKFEERFNKFIEKWCNSSAHLLDSDENDGEEIRDLIKENYLDKAILLRDYVPRLAFDAANIENAKLKAQSIDKEKIREAIDESAKGRKFQIGEDELNQINFAVCKCLRELKQKLGLDK